MTNKQLMRRWSKRWDPLIPIPEHALRGSRLPSDARQFLREVGLPRGSAPFLDFGPFTTKRLERVSDLFDEAVPGAEALLVIGSDGGEGIICLHAAFDGAVVLVDGEVPESVTDPLLMNTSPSALVHSLFHFQRLVDQVLRRVGAFLESRVTEEEALCFIRAVDVFDTTATEPHRFWRTAFDSLGPK